MTKRTKFVGITAICAALLAVPLSVQAAGPGYSGRYECTGVVEGEAAVSLTFDLAVVSHRGEDVIGAKVSLVDASDPGLVYAEFPTLSFRPGVDVPLTASVSLDRTEWDRWKSGAPPRVRLEGLDVDGTDLTGMVELVQISSPEVLQ